MKLINILTLIAENKPVPMMLKHKSMILTYDPIQHDYIDQKGNYLFMKLMQYKDKCLNDEIEVLKVHKVVETIKKLNRNRYIGTDISITDDILDKLDEIIDYINHNNSEEVNYYYKGEQI